MLNEEWKPIKEYEGYYEISNYGRVKRIKYDNIQNLKQYGKIKYLKFRIDKDGYLKYDLSLNGKTKRFLAHRLVAQAFLSNPNNLPCVNHKDGDKTNNFYENLEYCTVRYNNIHALETGLRNMKNNKLSKKVEQYDMKGNLIKIYESANEVKRLTGFSQGHVSECCRGEKPQYKGYIWKYNVK